MIIRNCTTHQNSFGGAARRPETEDGSWLKLNFKRDFISCVRPTREKADNQNKKFKLRI
ncbi:hypothetical protein [Algoriphagus namhaensis]